MRKIDLVVAFFLSLTMVSPVAAATGGALSDAVEKATPAAVLWASSYTELKDILPNVRTVLTRGKSPELQLSDAAYANVVWKNVTLVFDRDDSLAKIELTTDSGAYDVLKKRLSAGADPLWSLSGNNNLSSDEPDDAVMICEHADGSVHLTFNRTQSVAPRTMVARADPMPSVLVGLGD